MSYEAWLISHSKPIYTQLKTNTLQLLFNTTTTNI